jgi:hypothetical protein
MSRDDLEARLAIVRADVARAHWDKDAPANVDARNRSTVIALIVGLPVALLIGIPYLAWTFASAVAR